MTTERLDVDALLEEGRRPKPPRAAAPGAEAPRVSAETKARLNDLRTRLLALHKALLDDAKGAYEMDRGRIGSAERCCSSSSTIPGSPGCTRSRSWSCGSTR
jgi:hypothetical protein